MKRSGLWDLLSLTPFFILFYLILLLLLFCNAVCEEHLRTSLTMKRPWSLGYRKLKYNKTVSQKPMLLPNILPFDDKGLRYRMLVVLPGFFSLCCYQTPDKKQLEEGFF